MSSIATFYILPEASRSAFAEAQRNQKTVTYRRGWFGTKEMVTGDRFLWEYLDSATIGKTEFDFSGFVFIDYLLSFVTASLPEHLNLALRSAMVDDHYFAISADFASSLAEYLRSHPPEATALRAFVADNNKGVDENYVNALRETHEFLVSWFGRIAQDSFGVIHITF
jgi:hypothetical protein